MYMYMHAWTSVMNVVYIKASVVAFIVTGGAVGGMTEQLC